MSDTYGNQNPGSSISRDANPQLLVFRQIDRKALAGTQGQIESWKSGINELIAQLPEAQQKAILARENEYVIVHDEWVPTRTATGRTLQGNEHNPFIINYPRDLDYDPEYVGRMYNVTFNEEGDTIEVKESWVKGGPHWWSPEWKHWEDVDYTRLNQIVSIEMERVSLTWKHSKRDLVVADPNNKPKPRKNPPPTPMF